MCAFSILFILYAKNIFRELNADSNDAIVVNGEVINGISYASKNLLLTEHRIKTLDDMKRLLNEINEVINEHGMKMNGKKT